MTAVANTGYHFINWTKDGDEVSTNATYIFMVTESGDYVANFEPNTYTINASANPTAGGTVTGAGNYTHGQNVTLTAIPAEGYTFVNWTKNGVVITPSATYATSSLPRAIRQWAVMCSVAAVTSISPRPR